MKEAIIKYNEDPKESPLVIEWQELIRCKDCKFGFSEYGYVFCTKPYVEKGSANHKPDWFCADGKRRT